jgi:hypothetical protein
MSYTEFWVQVLPRARMKEQPEPICTVQLTKRYAAPVPSNRGPGG